jgi:hypothetical protein
VHAAASPAAAGQRDVERFLGEPRRQLFAGQLGAARFQPRFDALLGGVESGARGALFLGGFSARTEGGELPALAEIARFRVLERRRIARRREFRERALDDAFQGANGPGWP